MSRICDVTGKSPLVGNRVSHAKNRTKHWSYPNVQTRRIWVDSEDRYVRLKLSTRGLRTIERRGIDAVLADLRAKGRKI